MAELLIYDKDHWMDSLTEEQIAKLVSENKEFQSKYDERYQRGDVIEVRPDGYWTGEKAKGFNRNAFRVISVPNISRENLEYLTESLADGDDIKKARKYNISTGLDSKVTVTNMGNLSITEKTG